jgi:hypothetical protein
MIKLSVAAGVAVAFVMGAVSMAQTTGGPSAAPSDEATQPLGSTTPSGTPYSDSGGGLPRDPTDTPRMNASPNAGQHGADSAAQTDDRSDAAKIDKCKSMSSEAMSQNATCKAMMKKHPTMMNGGDSAPQ